MTQKQLKEKIKASTILMNIGMIALILVCIIFSICAIVVTKTYIKPNVIDDRFYSGYVVKYTQLDSLQIYNVSTDNQLKILGTIPYTHSAIDSVLGELNDSQHYNVGDTLLPDYVHTDTLIVTNGIELNKAFIKDSPSTDGEIMTILKQYTKPLK